MAIVAYYQFIGPFNAGSLRSFGGGFVPATTQFVTVECYGGGGAGVNSGGGGGGCSRTRVPFTLADSMQYFVGEAGSYAANRSSSSSFVRVNGVTICKALAGGSAGAGTGNPGAGAAAYAGIGDTRFSGGDGGNDVPTTDGGLSALGGGGGGGGRTVINGNKGSAPSGGALGGGAGAVAMNGHLYSQPTPGIYGSGAGGGGYYYGFSPTAYAQCDGSWGKIYFILQDS